MKFLSLLLLIPIASALAADAPPNTLTDAEKAAGWTLLFDGKDASASWRTYKKDTLSDKWIAKDGALVRTGGGDIITKEQFESFELTIDYKIGEGGNSGIMFRVQETDGPPYVTGPEIQVQDNVKGKDPQKAGWLYQFYKSETDATKPAGEWNTFRFISDKGKCTHWMNGVKYCEYQIGSPEWNELLAKSKFAKMPGFAASAKGHLCLQDHGNEVAFRNIKIRVIP